MAAYRVFVQETAEYQLLIEANDSDHAEQLARQTFESASPATRTALWQPSDRRHERERSYRASLAYGWPGDLPRQEGSP